MKKIFVSIITILSVTTITLADTYTLDNKYQENKSKNTSGAVGISTRFGYGFNYDAFTYGASLYYHGDGVFGFTAGFDGYYIPKGYIISDNGNKYNIPLPLWNVRAGLMITKYFAIGAMVGKPHVVKHEYDLITLETKSNAMFGVDELFTGTMYGGFVTIMLPVSKYFGFNFDFSLNNKMGFNVTAGINLQIPLKSK